MNEQPAISIVVPVYNEEDSLLPLYEQIKRVCESLRRSYEIVFTDDGSRDRTFELLKELHEQDPLVKVIRFRRNFGQTAAMAAGLEAARGEFIVSMDGDLQNDPADVSRLLANLEKGYDVVCGWRKDRKDKLISRRIPSLAANWLIGKITGVPIHDNGCSLKAYRARTIKHVKLYGDMHRFIPAMATLAGARITEIVVNHHPRRFGKSKYGISRIWRVILDIITVKMITSCASRPGLWFGALGFPFLVLGLLMIIAAGFSHRPFPEEWLVMSTAAFLLCFLGVHLFSLGMVSELFVKTGDYFPHESLQPDEEVSEVRS